ncbi:MAG: hypothetical protein A2Y17_11750 [Clostridiales bacterium GWF2_38_85]|nr:MAG: hypothetical protein A2Y17_11750 [Clostridiales bacterium GWF2_38_85]
MKLNDNRVPVTAPLLVAAVLLLLGITEIILPQAVQQGNNIFLVIIVIQIIVFILPCILYYYSIGRKLTTPMFIKVIHPSHLIFVFFVILMFITGNMLIKFFMYYITDGSLAGDSGMLSQFALPEGENNGLYIFLTFALIPAICEELFFRGVILSEYRGYGSVNAIVISALCFAMVHFSYENFFVYFFAGIIFGFSAVVTRSIFTPIILHLINNALNLYVDGSFLKLMMQESGTFFVAFVLVVLFSVSLLIVLARTESIYCVYAEKPPTGDLPPSSKSNIIKVFFSPAFLVLLGIFIVITGLS